MNAAAFPLWSDSSPPGLLASRDRVSHEIVFPALAPASPLASHHEPVTLGATGVVYSYTVIHPAAKSGQAPYALGYVDLPGPVRIFGRLQGIERPQIGDRFSVQADHDFGYVFAFACRGEGA